MKRKLALIAALFLSAVGAAPNDTINIFVVPSPSPSPSLSPSPAPSAPIVSAVQADYIAQAAANLSTSFCASGRNTNSADEVTAAGSSDALDVAYLKTEGWRGTRDGSINTCYSQSQFDTFANNLYQNEGIDFLISGDLDYTSAELSSIKTTLHGARATLFGNEWDVYTFSQSLAVAVAAGATSITTGSMNKTMVPGSSYSIAATGGTDTFTFTGLTTSDETGSITPALTYPAPSGAVITRISTAAQDMQNWLAYYGPLIAAAQPTFPIMGPSFAFPIYGQNTFPGTTGYLSGVQIMEAHDYPNFGYNPEGPTGDGSQSYTSLNHLPCSTGENSTSYSLQFNDCGVQYAVGKLTPSTYIAKETTEGSWEIVQDGSAPVSGNTNAIPDKIGIHYALRYEAELNKLGADRVYYFDFGDCVDPPPSGFATYGLHFGGVACPGMPAAGTTIVPKATELALQSYINAWTDPSCKYGGTHNCYLTPSNNIRVGFSNSALPFQYQLGQFSNGDIQLGLWLGSKEYDPTNTGTCANTTSCILSVTPISQTITIPNVTSAYELRIDDTSSDPTPAPAVTTAPDGTVESGPDGNGIILCPLPYATTPKYGCWTKTALTITNGDQVTVPVDGDYEVVRATVSGLTSPSPTVTTTPLPPAAINTVYAQTPVPASSTSTPSPAPTATATPTPSPTRTPSPSPTAVATIGIVQSASVGGLYATSGTTYGGTLPSTPTPGNLLLALGTADALNRSSSSAFTSIVAPVNGNSDVVDMLKYVVSGDSTVFAPLWLTDEANEYTTGVMLELSYAKPAGGGYNGYAVAASSTNTTPTGNTYVPPTLTTASNGAGGAAFVVFSIEDFNGITSATPASGWTLLGPYAQNNGTSTANQAIKMYVEYNLNTTANTSYAPPLTFIGTPSTASAVIQSIAISHS